jgi:uncharacterized protein (TIGR00296 family)
MESLSKPDEEEPLQASALMCYHCFDVLVDHLTSSDNIAPRPLNINPKVECPLFVTWELCTNNHWHLRGCIGTLSPRPLYRSVKEYALTSATRDRRFHPISFEETPLLRVGVSLLIKYQPCKDVWDWTIGVHGILIKFCVTNKHYSATYLPEVAHEQGWDHQQAIASLIQKAGYTGKIDDHLYPKIQCTRYQSSKHKQTFQDYLVHKGYNPLPPTLTNKSTVSSCNIN